MMLSKACEYGIRAAMYLAGSGNGQYVPIRTISQALDISYYFLPKIFQMLTQADLVQSFKGPNGGIKLARPAEAITLRELVDAIDGPGLFTECILGLPGCGNEKPCPLHEKWRVQRAGLDAVFSNTTLAEIARDMENLDLRLAPIIDLKST